MTKVVWLFPPAREGSFPNLSQYRFYKNMKTRSSIIYPYLAASGVTLLKEAGHDPVFLDCPTMGIRLSRVEREVQDADLVVLEARTPVMFQIWQLVQWIKEVNPGARTGLYGDHVSWRPGESLARPGVDYIIQGGDFDRGVLELANLLEKGADPPSVIDPGLCDLGTLPWVDRELVPWRAYYEAWRHRETFLWTMSSRGCWHQCIFCSWVNTLWGGRFRYRAPDNVAREYQALYERYGELEILDDADIFPSWYGVKLARALLELGLGENKVLWGVQTHPNEIFSLQSLQLMYKAGLRTVKLGLESGNQRTLDIIRKGTSIRQSEKAISLLKEAGLFVHANLMVGWPWETLKEAYHTIDWIKAQDPNQAQFSLVIPYPNTMLYKMARQNGYLAIEPGAWSELDASKAMLVGPELTREAVATLYRDSWARFYFDPGYVWRHVRGVRHMEGLRQLVRGYRSIRYGHMRAMD